MISSSTALSGYHDIQDAFFFLSLPTNYKYWKPENHRTCTQLMKVHWSTMGFHLQNHNKVLGTEVLCPGWTSAKTSCSFCLWVPANTEELCVPYLCPDMFPWSHYPTTPHEVGRQCVLLLFHQLLNSSLPAQNPLCSTSLCKAKLFPTRTFPQWALQDAGRQKETLLLLSAFLLFGAMSLSNDFYPERDNWS